VRESGEKIAMLTRVFIRSWFLPLLPLLAAISMVRGSRVARWSLAAVIGLPLIQMLCTPWMRNQYMAPVAGFFFTLVALGLWRLDRLRYGEVRYGRSIVTVLVLLQLFKGGVAIRNQAASVNLHDFGWLHAMALEKLRADSGGQKALVFVHHRPDGPTNEFVWNAADIDASPIVFARDMGEARNQELMAHYPDRRVWMLNVDPFRLTEISR
jgi:hypothetical protein